MSQSSSHTRGLERILAPQPHLLMSLVLGLTSFYVLLASEIKNPNAPQDSGTSETKKRTTNVFILQPESGPWQIPPMGLAASTGFGMEWGQFGAGASFLSKTRFGNRIADGAATVAVGLGNSRKHIGLEVSVVILNLDPLFKDGVIGLKVHHTFLNGFALAVQADTVLDWGTAGAENEMPITIAGSKSFTLKQSFSKPFSLLTVSVGAQIGRFITDLTSLNRNPSYGIRPFFGTGVRLLAPLSFIVDYDGLALNSGFGLTPFRSFPLSLTFGLMGVVDKFGGQPRFLLAAGYGTSVFDMNFPVNVVSAASR